MKILLITFSGTGNTIICGNFLKKHLEELNNEVEHFVFKKDKKFEFDVDNFDLIGIGYPIHGFNIPYPFYKFLSSLKKVNNKNYFIYKVSGEPFAINSASSAKINSKLKKKGYNLVLEHHFLMPYNIMFNYKKEIQKQMYLNLESLTKMFALKINNQEFEKIKYKPLYELVSFLVRIERAAGPLNSKIAHVKKKKCIKCYKCVNECPTNSLYLNKKGEIKIKSSCCICTKCVHDCPVDAFNFGILNAWKVNGKFSYDKLVNDNSINGNYINKSTKGYFKHFKKYLKKEYTLLDKYNIYHPNYDIVDKESIKLQDK